MKASPIARLKNRTSNRRNRCSSTSTCLCSEPPDDRRGPHVTIHASATADIAYPLSSPTSVLLDVSYEHSQGLVGVQYSTCTGFQRCVDGILMVMGDGRWEMGVMVCSTHTTLYVLRIRVHVEGTKETYYCLLWY